MIVCFRLDAPWPGAYIGVTIRPAFLQLLFISARFNIHRSVRTASARRRYTRAASGRSYVCWRAPLPV